MRIEESDALIKGNSIINSVTGVAISGGAPTLEGNVIEGGRVGLYATTLADEPHPRATDYQAGPFVRGNTITGASHFGVIVEDVPAELTGNTICAERQSLKIEGEANLVIGTNEICDPEPEA